MAHEGDGLAGLHVEVEVLEDGDALDVVELDVLEVDAPLDLVELEGVVAVADAGHRLEDLEDALAAGHGALQHRVLHH